jgi:uncharacterized protein
MADAEIGGDNTLTPDRGGRMKLYFLLCSQLARAAVIPTGHRLLADDVVLHAAGRHPLAGEFAGKQAFLDAYTKTLAALGGTVEAVAIQDLLVGPERAVALVRERATRGEQVLEFDRVNVYRLRDGQIVEIWSYDFDPYALDAFWA